MTHYAAVGLGYRCIAASEAAAVAMWHQVTHRKAGYKVERCEAPKQPSKWIGE